MGLLWAVALAAIVVIFLGGAGLIMLGAGNRTPATFALVGFGVCAAGYLGWFLSVGPGREPEKPAPTWTPRTTSLVAATGGNTTVRSTPARRLRCWFCGATETARNRLIWGERAAICEECTVTAGQVVGTLEGAAESPDLELETFIDLRRTSPRRAPARRPSRTPGRANGTRPDGDRVDDAAAASMRQAG